MGYSGRNSGGPEYRFGTVSEDVTVGEGGSFLKLLGPKLRYKYEIHKAQTLRQKTKIKVTQAK